MVDAGQSTLLGRANRERCCVSLHGKQTSALLQPSHLLAAVRQEDRYA